MLESYPLYPPQPPKPATDRVLPLRTLPAGARLLFVSGKKDEARAAPRRLVSARAYIYRVRRLERPLPLRLYLYFLKRKGTAAICTFYLKKGAIPYSQIPPVYISIYI